MPPPFFIQRIVFQFLEENYIFVIIFSAKFIPPGYGLARFLTELLIIGRKTWDLSNQTKFDSVEYSH